MYIFDACPDINFENENAKLFADYWASLPKVEFVPMRSSFDPCDVPAILSTFVIHEFRDPDVVHVRLLGTELADRYGFDITGTNYLDTVHPDRKDKVWRALSHIVEHPCGMLVYIEGVRESGMVEVSESVGFPFRDDAGDIGQVIYQNNLCDAESYWDYRNDQRKASRAIRRRYIDIGAGIPDWCHSEDSA
ncbi:MAG: PAS domain-containing protein [Rhodospirillaceae bacterium]|nr:PAS domain-containing protein [Rhodospirillaceae bacterium]